MGDGQGGDGAVFGAKKPKRAQAEQALQGFLERLRTFRVLDPACGSGNFLYLALRTLKDIEHQVMLEAEALGLQRGFPAVGPEAVIGIEINPYAAELARLTVWIGEIQWMLGHGYSLNDQPILKPLNSIECRDALLTPLTPGPSPTRGEGSSCRKRLGPRRTPLWAIRRSWAGEVSGNWAMTTWEHCARPMPVAFRVALIWSATGLKRRGRRWKPDRRNEPDWWRRTPFVAGPIARCWSDDLAPSGGGDQLAIFHAWSDEPGSTKARQSGCRWWGLGWRSRGDFERPARGRDLCDLTGQS